MIEIFWYFLSSLVFFGCMYALFSWNKHVLSKKIIADSQELEEKIKKYQARLNKMSSYPQENVKESIEGMGVEGIIDSLGLPAIFKPIAKGFLSNPKNIEMAINWAKKLGVNLHDANANEVSGLL